MGRDIYEAPQNMKEELNERRAREQMLPSDIESIYNGWKGKIPVEVLIRKMEYYTC